MCARAYHKRGGREGGRDEAVHEAVKEARMRAGMKWKEILLEENAGEGEGERGRSAIRDKVIE